MYFKELVLWWWHNTGYVVIFVWSKWYSARTLGGIVAIRLCIITMPAGWRYTFARRDSNNVKLCTWNLVSIILRWRLIVPRAKPMYTTRGTGTLWCLVCAAFNRIENRFRKEYVKNSSSLRRMFLRIIALCLCEFRWVFQFETSLCGIHMSPLLLTWLRWILVTGQWPKNICVKHQDHISPLWYLCIDICKSLIVLRRWRKNVNLPWSLWRMTHPRLLRANI